MSKKKNRELCLVLLYHPNRTIRTEKEQIDCFEKETGVKVLSLKLESQSQRLDIIRWMFECNMRYHQINFPEVYFGCTIYTQGNGNLGHFLMNITDDRIERLLMPDEDAMAVKLKWF